ncbi:16S rRNA (guanine(527)-N(7))-methyltransferase [Sarracenia purpurea var. burkii]
MLAFCYRVSLLSPFSVGTFVKHLPVYTPATLNPNRNNRRTLTTTGALYTPLFEGLTSRQKEQIHLYVDALLHWNQKMNLTAVTEASEVMERHVEDSLAIIPPVQSSYAMHCGASHNELRLIDVGTGAGLPGLILAIACPGWKVTLLESINKRCVFLEHAVGLIGLSNVQVIRERAEEEVRRAERAIHLMGASVLQMCSVESHGPHGQRTAVVCLKDGLTPRKYPRDPATERNDYGLGLRIVSDDFGCEPSNGRIKQWSNPIWRKPDNGYGLGLRMESGDFGCEPDNCRIKQWSNQILRTRHRENQTLNKERLGFWWWKWMVNDDDWWHRQWFCGEAQSAN